MGAVLTGGESRRMGSDKATLVFQDRPLAERAVDALRQVFTEVIVVSNGQPDHETFGVPVVADFYPGCGPLGGLHAALQAAAAPQQDVFLLACDMPFVSPELVSYLAGHEIAPHTDEAEALVPQMNDRLEPLCAVYSSACLGAATEALVAESFKMQDFLSGITTRVAEITPDLPFFDSNLFSNVNRPGDLIEVCEKRSPLDSLPSRPSPTVKA